MRYVERNPLRARIVRRAENWRWSSLGQSMHPASEEVPRIPICRWPVKRRRDWVERVNQPQTSAEMAAVFGAIRHNRPWQPVVKVARPLLASSGRALRCRDLPVFGCNTTASRRLDPGPMPQRTGSRDFNHGLLRPAGMDRHSREATGPGTIAAAGPAAKGDRK